MFCTGVMSCWNLRPLSSSEGKCYSIHRHSRQLCISDIVGTVWGSPTYRCEGQVFSYVWACSVINFMLRSAKLDFGLNGFFGNCFIYMLLKSLPKMPSLTIAGRYDDMILIVIKLWCPFLALLLVLWYLFQFFKYFFYFIFIEFLEFSYDILSILPTSPPGYILFVYYDFVPDNDFHYNTFSSCCNTVCVNAWPNAADQRWPYKSEYCLCSIMENGARWYGRHRTHCPQHAETLLLQSCREKAVKPPIFGFSAWF